MWHGDDVGWGWWLVMSIGMAAFWALVILGAVWFLRGADDRREPGDAPEPAEPPGDVLKRRLAAGEITVEEYQEVRRALDDAPELRARSPGG